MYSHLMLLLLPVQFYSSCCSSCCCCGCIYNDAEAAAAAAACVSATPTALLMYLHPMLRQLRMYMLFCCNKQSAVAADVDSFRPPMQAPSNLMPRCASDQGTWLVA
jgi:hypothetical protein